MVAAFDSMEGGDGISQRPPRPAFLPRRSLIASPSALRLAFLDHASKLASVPSCTIAGSRLVSRLAHPMLLHRSMKGAFSSKSEPRHRLEPFRLIPIERAPKRRVPTRIGIGEKLVGHAAGPPLNARSSQPGVRSTAPPSQLAFPPPRIPEPSSDVSEIRRMSELREWRSVDAPVHLPMRRTWVTVWTVLAILLIPLAIVASLYFGSRRSG